MMKNMFYRIVASAVVLVMLMSMLVAVPFTANASAGATAPDVTVAADADKWDGSTLTEPSLGEDEKYHISTAAQFAYLLQTLGADATSTAGKTYVLDNDIDMNSKNLATKTGAAFGGTFDGQGHTIANMHADISYGYFFGNVTGNIQNVNFLKCKMTCSSLKSGFISTLAAGAVVENVHINYADSTAYRGGGIAFTCDGTIKDCIVSGIFRIATEGGGIVASLHSNTEVSGCVNYADINSGDTNSESATYIGGIVGAVHGSNITISENVNYGIVSGGATLSAYSAYGISGIVGGLDPNGGGYAVQNVTIKNCTNYGAVTNTKVGTAAGIVGRFSGTGFNYIEDCTNYGAISSADGYSGGIVGVSNITSDNSNYATAEYGMENCYNYGAVTAATSAGTTGIAGGIVAQWTGGTMHIKHFLINSGNFGSVSATGSVGGVAGTLQEPYSNQWNARTVTWTNLVAVGEVTGTSSGAITGSLVGQMLVNTASSSTWVLDTVYAPGNAVGTSTASHLAIKVVGNHVYTTIANDVVLNGMTGSTASETGFELEAFCTKLNTYATANSYTPWVKGKTVPTPLTSLGFSGATMTLGGNMALNMKLDADALTGLDILHVTFVDADTNTGVQATIDENGYYNVSYDKRAAEMAESMNLQLLITLTNGESYRSTNILTYSPAKYLTNLYEDYTGEKKDEAKAAYVLDVVKNMLAYGAESEAKRDGIAFNATETAKAAGAAGITLPTDFTYTNEHTPGVLTQADRDAINSIALTGASLTGSISITFQMENTAYTTLTVDGNTTYEARDGYIIFEDVPPAQILETFKLVFSGEGVEDVTANFCIGDFLELRRQANTDDDAALAAATIRYMMAVREYALKAR